MLINQWAKEWGIEEEAVADLLERMGLISTDPESLDDSSPEGVVQSKIRLEASKKGMRLFRNNVGVALDENGIRCLRYGLANDSAKLNEIIKSSDLIGIRKVLITEEMVGCVIGQFVAREIKRGGWVYSATERERAQLNFLELILSFGGDAGFATSEGTL